MARGRHINPAGVVLSTPPAPTSSAGSATSRAAWEERGWLLAGLEAWCETWRGNLDTADYALMR